MFTLSAPVAARQYELWLFTPGGAAEPLSDCGVFGVLRQAEMAAAAILDWFHLGVWPAVLDRVNPDAQDEFFFRRKGLLAGGGDAAAVRVEVRPWREFNDNRDSRRPSGWTVPELDATAVHEVTVFHTDA